MRSAGDLGMIAEAGATIIISEDDNYATYELRYIAQKARIGGGQLIVKGSIKYGSWDLVSIAREAPGQVVFEE
jgi:hypothetical protein